jgi:hypothetical protein
MQVGSVSSAPAVNIPPSTSATAEAENAETATNETENTADSSASEVSEFSEHSSSSSTIQEKPDNPVGLIINQTTLEQLLEAATPTVEKLLGLDENENPELFEEKPEAVEEKIELPAETKLKVAMIKLYLEKTAGKQVAIGNALQGSWHEAIGKQNIDEMLKSVNALLKDAKLTREQFHALVSFNSTANQLTEYFADPKAFEPPEPSDDPDASPNSKSSRDTDILPKPKPSGNPDASQKFKYLDDGEVQRKINSAIKSARDGSQKYISRHEEILTHLESSFDILADSFDSVTRSNTAVQQDLKSIFGTKMDQLRDSLEHSVMTSKNIVEMVEDWTDKASFEELIGSDVNELLCFLDEETIKMPDSIEEYLSNKLDRWSATREQKENTKSLIPQFFAGLKPRMSLFGFGWD